MRFRSHLGTALLACACAFESGGVLGGDAGDASIGSADPGTSGTSSGTASSSASTASSAPGTTVDPSAATTNSDPSDDDGASAGDAPPADDGGTSGPMIAESSGDGTSGNLDPTRPLDSGDVSMTDGAGSSDGGAIPDGPYYGNCDAHADCEPGVCYVVGVVNGPNAAVCLLPCGDGCPEPEPAVDAMPVCTMSGHCTLSCADSDDCPAGMSCYGFENNSYFRCLWSQG